MQKHFNQYFLIEQLGNKPCRSVYLAHRVNDVSQKLVLKVFDAACLISGGQNEALRQRVEALKQLRHVHVAPILDFGTEQGQPYVVSEYLSGNSLRYKLDKLSAAKSANQALARLSLAETLRIVFQVGQGLSYLHKRGILHGNIKAENILFNERGEALLTDLRLTGLIDIAKLDYHSDLRTIGSMAPEQFMDSGTEKSDQYSLACLAYELIAGQTPFAEGGFATMWAKHYTEVPAPLSSLVPDLPGTIEQAIAKAMAKSPLERHADVFAFMQAMGGIIPAPVPTPMSSPLIAPSLHIRQERASAPPENSIFVPFEQLSTNIPLKMDVAGTSFEVNLVGSAFEALLAGTPLRLSLSGTPLGASLAGTSLEAQLADIPLEVSLAGTAFDALLAGRPLKVNIAGNALEVSLAGAPILAHNKNNAIDQNKATKQENNESEEAGPEIEGQMDDEQEEVDSQIENQASSELEESQLEIGDQAREEQEGSKLEMSEQACEDDSLDEENYKQEQEKIEFSDQASDACNKQESIYEEEKFALNDQAGKTFHDLPLPALAEESRDPRDEQSDVPAAQLQEVESEIDEHSEGQKIGAYDAISLATAFAALSVNAAPASAPLSHDPVHAAGGSMTASAAFEALLASTLLNVSLGGIPLDANVAAPLLKVSLSGASSDGNSTNGPLEVSFTESALETPLADASPNTYVPNKSLGDSLAGSAFEALLASCRSTPNWTPLESYNAPLPSYERPPAPLPNYECPPTPLPSYECPPAPLPNYECPPAPLAINPLQETKEENSEQMHPEWIGSEQLQNSFPSSTPTAEDRGLTSDDQFLALVEKQCALAQEKRETRFLASDEEAIATGLVGTSFERSLMNTSFAKGLASVSSDHNGGTSVEEDGGTRSPAFLETNTVVRSHRIRPASKTHRLRSASKIHRTRLATSPVEAVPPAPSLATENSPTTGQTNANDTNLPISPLEANLAGTSFEVNLGDNPLEVSVTNPTLEAISVDNILKSSITDDLKAESSGNTALIPALPAKAQGKIKGVSLPTHLSENSEETPYKTHTAPFSTEVQQEKAAVIPKRGTGGLHPSWFEEPKKDPQLEQEPLSQERNFKTSLADQDRERRKLADEPDFSSKVQIAEKSHLDPSLSIGHFFQHRKYATPALTALQGHNRSPFANWLAETSEQITSASWFVQTRERITSAPWFSQIRKRLNSLPSSAQGNKQAMPVIWLLVILVIVILMGIIISFAFFTAR